MSNPKDKLENGVYILQSAARPWLAIQIGDIIDPRTKARKVTVEQIDESNKKQQWRSTFQRVGEFGYGLYTLQSQGEGDTGYYLTHEGAQQVRAELSKGQNLVWWSGDKVDFPGLRIFLAEGVPGIHPISYEGFAGTEVVLANLPPPPPGAPGGNWGPTWNLWTPIRIG